MESNTRIANDPTCISVVGEGRVESRWNIETQERSLDRITEWIRAADIKSSLLLAIDTSMIAAILGLSARPGGWTEWSGALILFGIAFLFASIVMAALSTSPQLTGKTPSLIFFGDIASRGPIEYSVRVESRTPSDYLKDLNAQCHRNSEVAFRKYRWIQRASMALFMGIIPWLIALPLG